MEKINIAELLKDCPSGMELDCTMFDNVKFIGVDDKLICVIIGDTYHYLTKFGTWTSDENAKCVIFPKGKTTWEGFHRPFKDGDIVYIRDEYSDATFTYVAIFKQIENGGHIYSHCFYNYESAEFSTDDYLYDIYRIRFATEEEKEKLFKAIKDNGYKWNTETKTLEKLPKFKVGDRIKEKQSGVTGEVIDVQQKKYNVKIDDNKGLYVYFREQDEWELVPNKFDINTLVPFESRVLVRDSNKKWRPAVYGFCNKFETRCAFYAVGGCVFEQCIPYEGNEPLLGTNDDCDEYFKTWK